MLITSHNEDLSLAVKAESALVDRVGKYPSSWSRVCAQLRKDSTALTHEPSLALLTSCVPPLALRHAAGMLLLAPAGSAALPMAEVGLVRFAQVALDVAKATLPRQPRREANCGAHHHIRLSHGLRR
jgi:hypothetical protein